VRQRGQLVNRDQIVESVWGRGVFLDTDNSINIAIRKIRQALKDDPEEPRFIQTITGSGYRFIAPVEPGATTGPEQAMAAPGQPITEERRPAVAAPTTGESSHRRLAVAIGLAAVLIAVAGIGTQWWRSSARSRATPGRSMLAVLPFANLTGDASQDYFSDGLTEEMISQLGNLDPQHLGVIARTSVMHYKNTATPLSRIGRELGVQYVLEGSVRRDSGRVRITVQLIQVSDQSHLWAREYDRELAGLLVLQDEVAHEAGGEIQTVLGRERGPGAAGGAGTGSAIPSYEAYDLYLKGRYFWNKRTPSGFREAAEYFQQAIAKNPDYARAYAGLADTYGLMSIWAFGPQSEFMPKARAAALKALDLDERLAEAHTSLAMIAENYDYDWKTAEKEFRRALELNPSYATAHEWYAEYLAWEGRFDEAFAESERARQLDPLSLIIAMDDAWNLYYAREYDRAVAQGRAVLDVDPSFASAWAVIVRSYVEQGKYPEALNEIARNEISRRQSPEDWRWIWPLRAYVYGRWGRAEEAQQARAEFEKLASQLEFERPQAALLYSYTGQKDREIALLEDAYAKRSNVVTAIKVDPMYDPLRGDPRFHELVRKVGLAQ
jgi:TolB-like protein/DNA-binding winged helix-turn-helix (wHTH) protein/Flp pilus assembly protein TadD